MARTSSRERIDRLLLRRGLFTSRKQAQDAVAAGLVTADGAIVAKSSATVALDAELSAKPAHPWASRGGVKLDAALRAFRLDPGGKICLDVGASTGGFTDVLLASGARRIYAVDVGHGQLDGRLAADPRVVALEGTDARTLRGGSFAEPPQFVVCDVSFISLRLVLPHVLGLAAASAELVCLVKPQFEAGRSAVVKGLVRDSDVHARVCAEVETLLRELGWTLAGTIASPIEGGSGNREFLIGAWR